MKIEKFERLVVCLLLLAIGCGGCFFVNYTLKRSVEAPEGVIEIPGLRDEVSIRRDGYGIPVVEAACEDDLFLATGYAMASDRLWQMVIMKMVAQGRLAEVVGPEALSTDYFMRSIGIKMYSDKAYEALADSEKRLLEQFSAGVNAYLRMHEHLPIEFDLTGYEPEPWRPEDSLSIFGLINFGLASNITEELAFLVMAEELGPRKAAYLFPVYPDEELPFREAEKLAGIELAGIGPLWSGWAETRRAIEDRVGLGGPASNNWAIAGARTASGRSIVANDTHLYLTMPSFWLIMHLKSPTYEAAGVMVPGIPLITLGFNGRIAWGATMVMGDNQDIFLEKIETRGGEPCAVYEDGCLPLGEREEVFRAKGEPPVVRPIRFTRHGTLLNQALEGLTSVPDWPGVPIPFESGYGLAYRWSMADGERSLTAFYRLGKAADMIEAREALALVDSIYLNIVHGDAGNIAWQATGRYPVRKSGTGHLPSPGWSGEFDWDGYLSFEDQPYSLNPAEGFIATANNRTVGRNAPHHLTSSWYGPERSDRIKELLGRLEGATYRDAMKMHADQYSLMAAKTQRLLFEGEPAAEIRAVIDSWADGDRKEMAKEALELLGPERFDCVMGAGSASAAVMGAFHHSFTRNVFLDELGPEGSLKWEIFLKDNFDSYAAPEDHLLVRSESPFFDDAGTPAVETKAEMMARSLADAYALCADRMGGNTERWKWGSLHTYTWRHPVSDVAPILRGIFNRGPFPAGGDMHTLNVTGYRWGGEFDVLFIPAMRMVVDYGLEEPAFLIIPGGQSGDPASPHYDDMIDPWRNVENNPLPFQAKNIEEQYRRVLILRPASR